MMQSPTRNTFVRQPQVTTSARPNQHQLSLDKLEKFAVARLQHTVDQLKTQVNYDRSVQPPVRKIFHCICDDTSLTANIPDLKRFIADKTITMLVPLCALDALDKLKKGTDPTNIHARESIRFFDRVQSTAGRRAISGIRIQDPSEKFSTWAECVAQKPFATLPMGLGESDTEPPARIKDILNCVIYATCQRPSTDDHEVLLVTNDEIMREWAFMYNIPCIASAEIEHKIKREQIEYAERRRHYEWAQVNLRSPTSPTRGGRGGAAWPRGGTAGRGSPGLRRNSYQETSRRMDPDSFGHGGRILKDMGEPEFTLRGPQRGVARGRGRLWEP